MAHNLTEPDGVIGAQRRAVLCPGTGNIDAGVIVGGIGTFDEELEEKFKKSSSPSVSAAGSPTGHGSRGGDDDVGRGQSGNKTDGGDQQRQPDRQMAYR
jgi:hypothetical protein